MPFVGRGRTRKVAGPSDVKTCGTPTNSVARYGIAVIARRGVVLQGSQRR